MAEITMPRLSDTMSEGTVARWLKQPGDTIEPGDILLEIETDKATMELEAFESGTLQKIIISEGQTVPIGEVIGMIGDGPLDETAVASTPAPASVTALTAEATATPTASTTMATETHVERSNGSSTDDHIKASPLARRLASEYGIDLAQVQGTGPGGRIVRENVENFRKQGPVSTPAPVAVPTPPTPPTTPIPTPAASASADEVVPMSRMRRAIARAMTESKPGVPHIYVTMEIDMAEAMLLRKQINENGASDVKVSVNDMVIKAAAKALLKFPALNSSYAFGSDGQPGVVQHPHVHVSVAVAIEDGLLAPVVKDADTKSLGTIAADIRELAGRARDGKSKQTDLEGGTFQVSNMGMFNVVEFVSIISVPQAASLSVGAVRQTPVVRDGKIVVGQVMNVTLSVDHRVTDGATAAQYLQELKRLLEIPMSILV
ncbi:MAG: 2-oxo acid dehydrogenase subunit E2 [Chloroflexi bacterium AL-W]|nr:2-oxo acid dehydrogenase subunit E2 [Chloroflexi bacterium AL-N1]NOK66674.1 2-oxo acid dehydrogenase subunit E2 [Chloroflexi bacterium AL-N10]NOK72062.1 2-oxo acid dehydrogenase subunit E2 [Chloroflexi bacterium AL-N5]NOK81319.1 2-oxo acid dehydrogenase subunit E2 [Chloroflexi bacterium AL-W]NOK89592.1 2-oxo acid dehydrogenase subunit E2 [Chloroflexi bacterium AL-N15]